MPAKKPTLPQLAVSQGQLRDGADPASLVEMVLQLDDRRTLDGIEAFASLERLVLLAPRSLSLAAIGELHALRSLEIAAFAATDLDRLSTVPVRHLGLSLQRQASLAGLVSDTLLDLSATMCGIKTIDGVRCPALRRLDIKMNKVADLEPLRALPSVRNLDLQGNPASDLAPVVALTGLRVLSVCNMRKVKSLDPLRGLGHVTELVLTGVGTRDRSAVEKLDAYVLDVGGPLQTTPPPEPTIAPWNEAVVRAGIASSDALDELACLSIADARGDGLAGIEELRGLRHFHGPIATSLAGIERLESLVSLIVPVNMDTTRWELQEIDLTALAAARRLRRLKVLHPLSSVAALPAMAALQHLSLVAPRDGSLDLHGVERFEALQTLAVDGRVKDLSPLEGLPLLAPGPG